jgi:hypothetical protein
LIGSSLTLLSIRGAALLCKIAALRSFSLERLQYFRERESGMSTLAYFLARDTVDHFSTVLKPIIYLSMFYFFNNPRSSIGDNYVILLSLVYCVTGIGYTFAICFSPGSAQLVCTVMPNHTVVPFLMTGCIHIEKTKLEVNFFAVFRTDTSGSDLVIHSKDYPYISEDDELSKVGARGIYNCERKKVISYLLMNI